jgi:Zn-finger nucleic acid-binding protein
MRQYERGGVVIDQCAECRGIFLDRGELERLIDAETRWAGATPPVSPPSGPPQYDDHLYTAQPHYDRPYYDDHGYHHKRKKRKSFFEELFDD